MPGIHIGQVLQSQFRVDEFIASGGMGAVYRVWDIHRNVSLAMKVLHSDLADDPATFKYFQREANALKRLTHPHIVPFYGLYSTDDFVFMLQAFVDGPTLKEILKKTKDHTLSEQEALVYLRAVSSALGYAHTNQVVHCDVKPGNVMVDSGGNVYLADFGIARHAESTTTTIAVSGTPAYMAPEQIRGEPVSAMTDIYALGIMYFEMLTGRRPFLGTESSTQSAGPTSNERLRFAHLQLPPPDPRSINPAISPAQAQVILQAMTKNPAGRFSSTQVFFQQACLAAGAPSEAIAERVSVPKTEGYAPSDARPVQSQNQPRAASPGKKQTPWLWLALVGVMALLILMVGIMLSTGSQFGSAQPVSVSSAASPILRDSSGSLSGQPETAAENPDSQPAISQPTSPPVETLIFQTLQAELTRMAGRATLTPTRTKSPTFTLLPAPTRTPAFTPTVQLMISLVIDRKLVEFSAWEPCKGTYPSILKVGDRAYVNYEPPQANRVRSKPDKSGDVIGRIEPGEQMEVIAGPKCANGWVWWKVEPDNGVIGWTAEGDGKQYWLLPLR